MSKRLFFALFVVGLFSLSTSAASTPADLFAQANDAYQSKQYDSALVLFGQIESQGIESANLYFNIGNAYFKNGDLGHAVLYYLRASRLDPGDDDIRSNLEFAHGFTRVQMEGVRLNPISSFLESIVAPYRLNALAWIASFFFIVLIGLLVVRLGLGFRNSALKAGLTVALVLLVASAGITTFKYRTDYLTRRGVILEEDATVRTGPSRELDVELQGSPGLVVEILDESGDWYNVLFENKRRGWIRKELVAEV